MTEREQFEAMLKRANVPFREDGKMLEIHALDGSDGTALNGYSNFLAQFEFNAAGELKHVGIWE